MKQPLARPAGTCTVRPVISRTSRSPACEVASPSACEVASSSGPRRVRPRGTAGEGAAEAGQEGTSDGTRRVRTPFRGGSGGARPDHDRSCTAAGDAQLPLRTSVSSAESHSGDLPANDSAILVRRSKPPAPSLGSPGHREDACSRSAALLGQLATGLAHESVRRIEARLLGGTAGHRSRSSVRPAVTPDDTRAHRRKIRKAPEAQPARLTGRPRRPRVGRPIRRLERSGTAPAALVSYSKFALFKSLSGHGEPDLHRPLTRTLRARVRQPVLNNAP